MKRFGKSDRHALVERRHDEYGCALEVWQRIACAAMDKFSSARQVVEQRQLLRRSATFVTDVRERHPKFKNRPESNDVVLYRGCVSHHDRPAARRLDRPRLDKLGRDPVENHLTLPADPQFVLPNVARWRDEASDMVVGDGPLKSPGPTCASTDRKHIVNRAYERRAVRHRAHGWGECPFRVYVEDVRPSRRHQVPKLPPARTSLSRTDGRYRVPRCLQGTAKGVIHALADDRLAIDSVGPMSGRGYEHPLHAAWAKRSKQVPHAQRVGTCCHRDTVSKVARERRHRPVVGVWKNAGGAEGARAMDQSFRPVTVGAITLHACTFDDAATAILTLNPGPIRLVNAWCVVVAHDDPRYRALFNGRGLSFPDGAPVAAAMRRRGATGTERVRGPSLFRAVLDRGQATATRHYLLGSTPEVMAALVKAISRDYPAATIVGSASPPFGPLTDDLIEGAAKDIVASGADLVWVGMGAPKQDFACAALADRTGITCLGVGAAFDFVAGSVREAPPRMQRMGLEWAFRLATEPRRLWRRYVVGNVRFLWIARKR